MDKQIIKNIIIEKQVAIPNYKLIHRDFLFGDKSNYILVGLRRAGKSYLLYQDIQTRLQKGEQSAQDILYINFEDERLSSLKAEELGIILDSYMELYPGKQPLIYLDEIQNVEGWEKFARRLADSQYRVMITGSNAKMLELLQKSKLTCTDADVEPVYSDRPGGEIVWQSLTPGDTAKEWDTIQFQVSSGLAAVTITEDIPLPQDGR